jgi:hypothetical protein
LGNCEAIQAIAAADARVNELASTGAGAAAIERFLVDVFIARNRSIRNLDFQRLDPSSVVDDYLRPRRDLYCFVIVQWIRKIFIPSLKGRVAESMLLFGLGRLFSSYNDMGVQHCTDVDLNFIVEDDLSKADLAYLGRRLGELKADLSERFGVVLEVDPAYTILRAKDVASRLQAEDEAVREANLRFYKSNERSICVIHDSGGLRERVFSLVREEPDCRLFENFLGLEAGKQSYAKLRSGREALRIIGDGGVPVSAAQVIGSKGFDDYCSRLFPRKHFLSPPDWVFSMKYFVNRVYDYVGAMRSLGHSLEEIGFDAPVDGIDPDYRYLRNAHKLMLYLQELIDLTMGSYGSQLDSSYISRSRFLRFMELGGEKFMRDFDDMLLKGELLYLSDKDRYRLLRRKIVSKARDRFLTGKAAELALFPPDFKYDLVYKDGHDYKIHVPYSWADLGYFAFSAIARRIAGIVDGRLIPRLVSFGAEDEALDEYAEFLGEA